VYFILGISFFSVCVKVQMKFFLIHCRNDWST